MFSAIFPAFHSFGHSIHVGSIDTGLDAGVLGVGRGPGRRLSRLLMLAGVFARHGRRERDVCRRWEIQRELRLPAVLRGRRARRQVQGGSRVPARGSAGAAGGLPGNQTHSPEPELEI